jgi:hypothetical protein
MLSVSVLAWGCILWCPISLKVLRICKAEGTFACIRLEVASVWTYNREVLITELAPKYKPIGLVFTDVDLQCYTLENEKGEPFIRLVLRFFFEVRDKEMIRVWEALTSQAKTESEPYSRTMRDDNAGQSPVNDK